jgi:hypothetical protein
MSQFRVYFYSLKTRKELPDCPFNGKTWLQTSGMVRGEDGQYVPHTCTFVGVADYASLSCIKGAREVTLADFPGHDAIAVKIWYSPENWEWRKLVAES